MSPAIRRLCALTALFAPERAPALLARLPGKPGEAAAEAARLVAAARRERLRALGEVLALGAARRPDPAAAERPRVAEVLRAVAAGAPAGAAAPALARSCLEVVSRAAATCTRP